MLLVIDGLGARSVTPRLTPTLAGWGRGGLIRPEGAVGVMCASTYPNFASIVTGKPPIEHRIFTNLVVGDGAVRSGAEVGPAAPTLLDGSAEVVVGDQNLIGVTSAASSGRHWPPSGGVPDGVVLDAFGYVSDVEVTSRIVAALERRPRVLFAQLNGPDTVAHIHGPDSTEAMDCYRDLDRCLAIIGSALRPDDVLFVTSDHDQETVDPARRIDLATAARTAGVAVTVVHEGTAAMLAGADAADTSWLEDVIGVKSWESVEDDICLVFSEPGWWFAEPEFPDFRGAHGGPRTRATVAIATGAAAMLAPIAPRFLGPRLGAEDWFGMVTSTLDRH